LNIIFNLIIPTIILIVNSLFVIQPKIYDVVNAQTVENQVIDNTLEKVEEAIEQANNEAAGNQTVVVNETNSNIEQLKPISDEMLKYAEEIFPTLNDSTLSREDKVKILNQQFTDPESFLQNWGNLGDSIDSLDDHLNEVQEKLYIECTVNKESGIFNKTLDCTKWSAENAKGAPVPIY
jgi:myo-inositol-1-phosphate synthase